MHKRILLALDGSPGSFKALNEALALAQALGAELHSITVEEVPRYAGTVGEVMEAKAAANGVFGPVLEQARQAARQLGIDLHCHLFTGHEVRTIVEFARERAFDLLVVGFMGHSALYDRVMGSTCQGLVRLSPCSVLVVK
jgi:nucleotide-binding universal stress UspA family protein